MPRHSAIRAVKPAGGKLSDVAKEALENVGSTEKMVAHNITIGSRRTSIRIDDFTWSTLNEIARNENLTVHDLCSFIAARRARDISLTQAIRTFLVTFLAAEKFGRK